MCMGQVCWMPALVTWPSALCCFVAPFEGHVELIHGEPILFSSHTLCCVSWTEHHACVDPESLCYKTLFDLALFPEFQMSIYSKAATER